MKQISYQFTLPILMILLCVFISLPVLADEKVKLGGQKEPKTENHSGSEEKSLDIAREKLSNAFDSYKNGDIDATERNLKQATEWLKKASRSSKTEKARAEAHKLAMEIDSFKGQLNRLSEQQENDLARFWHRVTSLISRETDELIHRYVELSTAEKTLKYLLDAKMHLFTAEHDLFVSHEAEDAGEELGMVLDYLKEGGQVARPAIRDRLAALSKDIRLLKDNINTKQAIWKNDSVIQALDKALQDLAEADKNASPALKIQIDAVKTDIHALRVDVARNNIKNNYESAMATLQKIIHEL